MAILDLLDYRRRVNEIYRRVRTEDDPVAAWTGWTADRQQLFATHPQSAWESGERDRRRLQYFPYDPAWRFEVDVEPMSGRTRPIENSSAGSTPMSPIGVVTFGSEREHSLTVFWLADYGGGLFLPFGDLTNGSSTYGGGRYVLDTAKGADLGGSSRTLVIDFNFAYHPSCVHSPRWSCPLPPAENRLPITVEAGERLP